MLKENDFIKVILVEPIGPINLGSVARLCENFGIKELRIVSPKCDHLDPDSIKMAMRGKSLLKDAKIFPNLLEAIDDCTKVIATCGRIDHGNIPLYNSIESLEWLVEPLFVKDPVAIVFGREDRGLSNEELQLAQKVISLETSCNYPSLNLSHAVAIVLYELNKLKTTSKIQEKIEPFNYPYPKDLDNFLKDAENLLLEIGFLYKHTKKARMAKIKGFLQRGEVREEEISLFRGIIRQLRWFNDKKIP